MKFHAFRNLMTLLLILLFAVACNAQDSSCESATIDTVDIMDEQLHNSTNYSLVRRISGFQDKVISFELYDYKPTFNECSQSEKPPIFANSVDYDDRPVKGLSVAVATEEYEIVYGEISAPEETIKLYFK